ncbi:MAG: rod shape-determining protein MreD [Cycloclasticus sp.]|nr:rod shape-determining protein MreD [Cycloclasticus sp.]
MHARSSGSLIIYLSLFFSMCLSITPFSNPIAAQMPSWTLLTLMYWSIALPHKVSIGTGWLTGLLFDVLSGSLIGQHALIFSITTFFGHTLYSRLRNYRVWQQAIFILFFLLLMRLLSLWISQLNYPLETDYLYWLQVVTSALIWPLIFSILRLVRRRFRVQ